MGCEVMQDRDGHTIGFRCSRGRRQPPPLCRYCNRTSTKLCDGPGRTAGTTCDVPMCDEHAHPGGKNVDYCEEHKALAGNVTKLGLGLGTCEW